MLANQHSSEKDMARAQEILQSHNMTATVLTRSGSKYTIVTRPRCGVIMIDEVRGRIATGHRLLVEDGHLELLKNGESVHSSTMIIVIRILTN